ncbi:nucleoside ABC transporter membrane protein [Faunimonas pinastri]|uniref:Nucleoside ABC transporter membrane protein n=2 Tax=Faunimonas pinastri TaxID=1855383 RepID=A0A1H9LAK7_9HYPH|nr:nucleoside ABC transporter membrane protein [Faunimonas pinastri]
MSVLSPVIAIVMTLILGAVLFTALGVNPAQALYVYFVEPVTQLWSLEELVVKAAPLALIAIGLALCYRANVWNIGAEGQFTAGAIFGSAIPILLPDWDSWMVLPLMLILGVIGGMLYAAIPAILKNRFGANEILTSLMLSYIALLVLDWLVRGPWRDPGSFNFPQSVTFSDAATLPLLVSDGRLHVGVLFAVLAALIAAIRLSFSVQGFAIEVAGNAPRAARFSGFSQKRITLSVFLISGGLAGLAGICEVSGVLNQLRPEISPGYGFAAIIVAFLGRLNPLAILLAALLLALSYIGGEGAQAELAVSSTVTRLFQGFLLLMILGCDTLIAYKIRLVTSRSHASGEAARG